MSVNPAPMDQCTEKCRCLDGPNADVAYDCKEPCPDGFVFAEDECDCYESGPVCPNGVSATLDSQISTRAGSIAATTFFPALIGGVAGGGARVVDGEIQVFNGEEFIVAATSPYLVGEEYLGEAIVDVVDSIVLGECAG